MGSLKQVNSTNHLAGMSISKLVSGVIIYIETFIAERCRGEHVVHGMFGINISETAADERLLRVPMDSP